MYHLFRNALVYVVCICPKYKMICLKSPKSSEFAIIFKKQWSKFLNYVDFIIFLTTIHLIWVILGRSFCIPAFLHELIMIFNIE